MRFTSFSIRLLSLTFVEAVRYGNNHVPVRRDNALVASNFPDVDVTLSAPAFLDPTSRSVNFSNGTEGPTDDASMDYFMRSTAQRNEWASYRTADFKSEEGRAFPYMFLSTASQRTNSNSTGKLRVWCQGAVHGNEPSGDQSLLALLGKMDLNATWTASLLEKMDIILLPRYNPDGVAFFQRTFASNLDPNRDHIKLARQQTKDIKKLFNSFAPHVAIDMHEYSGPSIYGGSYVHASDALYSAAKNLNIHPAIRDVSENVFATQIAEDLENGGFRWEPYVTGSSNSTIGSSILFREAGSDAKIGRNALGLTQSISFLCETRGIGLADQEFQRRTAAALTMVQSILQTAADNAESLYRTVDSAIQDFVASRDSIIITDHTNITNRTFTMIDTRNGTILQLPVRFASTTPVTANLTRLRPEAYLIPRAWSNIADLLQTSGLEVTTLNHVYRGTVQALNITTATFGSTYYEGIVPVTVTTEVTEREIELEAGSFLISTRQRNAALAFVSLEPENIDSYVSFNIIPVEAGDEYPIFRIMS